MKIEEKLKPIFEVGDEGTFLLKFTVSIELTLELLSHKRYTGNTSVKIRLGQVPYNEHLRRTCEVGSWRSSSIARHRSSSDYFSISDSDEPRFCSRTTHSVQS